MGFRWGGKTALLFALLETGFSGVWKTKRGLFLRDRKRVGTAKERVWNGIPYIKGCL
jgi:hypothetical protein